MRNTTSQILAGVSVATLAGAAALAVEMFGLEHTALGGASISVVPDGLSINNLGSTGKDGVCVTIPPPPSHKRETRNWEVTIAGHTLAPGGETYRVAALGLDPGGVSSEACSMSVVLDPLNPEVHFDFGPCAPLILHGQYFFEGALVAEEIGALPPGPPSVGLAAFAGGTIALPDIGFSAHFDNIKKIWRLDGNMSTERTVGGSMLPQCDSWIISAEQCAVAFDGLTSLEITTIGPSEFIISDEQFVETILGDLNGDCVVDTADLGLLISAFGAPALSGDLNGDGVTDTADLGLLIAGFGTECSV